jgi:hypothetical protein
MIAAFGGLPVRETDYHVTPSLADVLTLPVPQDALDVIDNSTVQREWSKELGHASVLLVTNVMRARALVLQAAHVQHGEEVGVPANADRSLVESIKQYGAQPVFMEINQKLGIVSTNQVRCCWAQFIGGIGQADGVKWVDCADTLPQLGGGIWPSVTLFGLHLDVDENKSGALLVFGDAEFAQSVAKYISPNDTPNCALALRQLHRLRGVDQMQGIAYRQSITLAESRRGVRDAAGLRLADNPQVPVLAHHVAIRIPNEIDAATFYAYVKAEQTPVMWLPELRPLHYAAVRNPHRFAASAAEMSRWLFLPVGPDYSDEEISHAVLGVVKAAEYLGVRWRIDVARATEYAFILEEWYGENHDAYRPIFSTDEEV